MQKPHTPVKIIGALLILLLLAACGTKDDTPPSQPDSDPAPQTDEALPEQTDEVPPEQTAPPELEETDWEETSDAGVPDLSGGMDNPDFEDIFNHTDTVPLDQLVAFSLAADGLSEGAHDEIYHRFLEAPRKVLTYLESLGDEITELPGWEPMPAAEIICQFIATTDAVMYGGTEDFAQTMSACLEDYPEGRIAELLDVMDQEYAEALERFQQ